MTNRRRLRRRRFELAVSWAAQIEQLESRALLTVTYNGGALLPHVEAQAVYLGSQWATSSSLQSQEGQIDQFLGTIVNSPYMDMLTNAGYGVGRGSASTGSTDNISLNTSSGITDAQIQSDVQAMITAGQLQAPDANRLYVVYVEPGVVVHLGSDASNTSFLGYHGAFGGTNASGQASDIHYVVMPYPGPPNFSPQSQGFTSAFNEMTAVTSHELSEAVTDPNVNYKALGWYDFQLNGEIADLAEGHYATVSGYEVQDVVNQQDQIISPTTTQPPPTTLSAPTLAASVANSTTAKLTWNSVSGAQGYNVYLVNGSSTTLLGSVSASTTAVNVTGLTPGSSDSFMVSAFNATSTANSNVATVQMPAAAGLAAPQVTAMALSSTTALLEWNSVAGAQGYRVYLVEGGQRLFLGSVRRWTTAVEITGMSPGTSYSFQVEAFNFNSVADSAVVTVQTPQAASAFDRLPAWARVAAQMGDPAGPSEGLSGELHHRHHFR